MNNPPARTFRFQQGASTLNLKLQLDSERPNHKTMETWLSQGVFYEPDVSQFIIKTLSPGDTVIDIGANLGYFTMLAALLVGEQGTVIAFEPDEANITDIKTNAILNGVTARLRIIDKPAKEIAEETSFFINSDNSGGNALWDPAQFPGNIKSQADGKKISMRSTTVDAEVKRLGIAKIKLIKIDTEGAEELVLRGALQTIIDCEPTFVICELHNFGLERLGCSQQSLRTLMKKMGYDCFVLGFKAGLPHFVPEGSVIATPFIANVVFTRPEHLAPYWPTTQIDPRGF